MDPPSSSENVGRISIVKRLSPPPPPTGTGSVNSVSTSNPATTQNSTAWTPAAAVRTSPENNVCTGLGYHHSGGVSCFNNNVGVSCQGPPLQQHNQSRLFQGLMPQQQPVGIENKDSVQRVPPQQQQGAGGYIMGYQVPLQQHHHHHSSCHPHHHQQPSSTTMTSSQVAAAAAAHMRSMVMSHYPAASAYGHSSAPTPAGYYQNTGTANMPYVDYNHHGHGMTAAAAAAAAQYAQQHRVAAAVSTPTFRPHPSHPKVLNPNQAAVYQQAYQYQQYMHHHQGGMLHSTHHHHQNMQGGSAVMHPRMVSVPMMNGGGNSQSVINQPHPQQAARLVPFINHVGQPMQVSQQSQNLLHQHHHHHPAYANTNQMMSGVQMIQPPPQPANVEVQNTNSMHDNKTKSCSSSSKSLKSQVSSLKVGTGKSGTSEKHSTSKLKSSKTCRARMRPPRLVVGQKKKSSGNSSSSSKKLRSSSSSMSITKSSTSPSSSAPSINSLECSSTWKILTMPDESGDAKCEKCSSDENSNVAFKDVNGSGGSFTDDFLAGEPILEEGVYGADLDYEWPSLPGCGCEHTSLSPRKPLPPPGFEHLMRPSFPIEQYDPAVLGNLMGAQLCQETISIVDGLRIGEMKEMLLSGFCCEEHAMTGQNGKGGGGGGGENNGFHYGIDDDSGVDDDDNDDDEWAVLERAIRSALDDRSRMMEEILLR